MIDIEEVKSLKRRKAELPNSIEMVSKRLDLDLWALTYLMKSGVLRACRKASPRTGGNRLYNDECDIQRFERRFISQTLLARQLGLSSSKLYHLIGRKRIEPIDMPPGYKRIFRREDVVALFAPTSVEMR